MKKYTQRQLKDLVKNGAAIDISYADNNKRVEIEKEENGLNKIGYASGIYGCNGLLFIGCNSKKLYAITGRTTAIFIFG